MSDIARRLEQHVVSDHQVRDQIQGELRIKRVRPGDVLSRRQQHGKDKKGRANQDPDQRAPLFFDMTAASSRLDHKVGLHLLQALRPA